RPTPLPTPFPYTTLFRSPRVSYRRHPLQAMQDDFQARSHQPIDARWDAESECHLDPIEKGLQQFGGGFDVHVTEVEATAELLKRSEEHTSELQSPDHLVC